jgi:hypothetical protein
MLKSSYKPLILLVFCMLWGKTNIFSQHDISKYEIRWAFWHPFAALKVKHRLPEAMVIYKEVKLSKTLDTLEFGGKLDAFRHTFTMACLAQTIKVKKLRMLGKTHEKGNKLQFEKLKLEFGERADSMACEMDLRNNEVGFEIGSSHKKTAIQDLKLIVLIQINAGKAWYLKRNLDFKYVDCAGKIIDMAEYAGKWNVPKCLIHTNE